MTSVNSWQTTERRFRRILVVGALAGMFTACSNIEPMSYTAIDEIPPGPGLFSGDDGVFTVYDSGRSKEGEVEASE